MTTLKYKPEYLQKATAFLQKVENAVNPPSELFDISKPEKMLSVAYTVIALENDEIAGIAATDKEGTIGLFAVAQGGEYSKCCKLLLNALERWAEKQELPYLFVLQTEACERVLRASGYAPFDNGSGGEDAVNEFQFAKEIKSAQKKEITPEDVKNITLDPKKRIVLEGKFSTLPAVFFGTACFFMLILAITFFTQAGQPKSGAFVTAGVVFSLLFVAALILTGYLVRGAKYKKLVLTMHVTNAVVTSYIFDGIWDLNDHNYRNTYRTRIPKFTRVHLTYEYYDENMQKREGKYTRLYRMYGPYFFAGQELIIACKGEKSYILRSYTILNQVGGQPESVETEKPRKSDFSEFVPLCAVRKYYFYSLSFASLAVVLLLILFIVSFLVSGQTGRSFGWELLDTLPFMAPLILIALVPSLWFLAVPLHAKRKLNKLLIQPDIEFVKGKLAFSEKTYKSDNSFSFYCEYYDGNEKKRVRVPRFFVKRMVNRGETSARVVFNKNTAVVLVRKDKYPNLFWQIR